MLGINPDTPFALRNKLKVFNIALFATLLISCFYMVMAVTHDYFMSTIVTIYSVVSSAFTLYAVHKRWYSFAFHFAMWYGFLFISAFSFMFGPVTNSYLYFLFLPIACNILFDDRWTIFVYFIISVIVTLVNFYIMDHFEPYYSVELSEKWLGYPNVPFVLVLIFLSVRLFKNENRKYAAQIEDQRSILEEKNKEITDSINYARRIQNVLLAPAALMKENLREHFILYKPKDIVSGDFYWAARSDDKFWLCVGDCTGHGVPGAFMSLLNISFLRELITEQKLKTTNEVLDKQREAIIASMNPDGSEESAKDGMDCAILCFERDMAGMQFSCANNPLWIMRDGELIEFRGDKQPVGLHEGAITPFKANHHVLRKGDIVYALTDGFADQFGGPKGKKFKYAHLKEVINSIQHLSMETQKKELDRIFDEWKGSLEQVDDVLIIGIRI